VANNALPLEIMLKIFDQLDAISLARASRVCRTWANVPWSKLDLGASVDDIQWIKTLPPAALFGALPAKLSSRFSSMAPTPAEFKTQQPGAHSETGRQIALSVLPSLRRPCHQSLTELCMRHCTRISGYDLGILETCVQKFTLFLHFFLI
jgi:hypothetical protein